MLKSIWRRGGFSLIAFFMLCGGGTQPYAALLTSSDAPYYTFAAGPYQLIFTQPNLKKAQQMAAWQLQLQNIYEKEFSWALDKKVPIVMASHHNQEDNAFVSLKPQLWSVFYPGGGYLLDRIASPSWLFILTSHETAHIYQMNAKKSALSRAAQGLFKNPYSAHHWQYAVWGLAMAPNALVPTWVSEGNATLNESRFNRGGRLYSGYVRATVLNALKNNQLTLKRLMNNHLDYHFANKYHWGAYVFKYLLEKWPHISPNALFYEHSSQPLRLNHAFKKVYGQSYQNIFKGFTKSLQSFAHLHQQAQSPVLQRSFSQAPMHRVKNKVFFLSSKTQRTRPVLNVYNTENGKWQHRTITLPMGKVFVSPNNEYEVPASVYTTPTTKQFSLVRPGYKAQKKFHNKIVYDRREGYVAYIDIPQSFNEAQLYVNTKHIGPTHSSALLNNKGDVYYFKQHKQLRTLYKNNTALFSFRGFYGFPVDIGSPNEAHPDEAYKNKVHQDKVYKDKAYKNKAYQDKVYFIASTPYGSGLFSYTNSAATNHIMRLHPSDAIVDAKFLGHNKFLITEIGAHSYEYKIIKTQAVKQKPAWYEYKWPQYTIKNNLASPTANLPAATSPITAYNTLKQTRLRSISPVVDYSFMKDKKWQLQLPVVWADPLGYNEITTKFDFINTNTLQQYGGQIEYAWLKHRLQVHVFSQGRWPYIKAAANNNTPEAKNPEQPSPPNSPDDSPNDNTNDNTLEPDLLSEEHFSTLSTGLLLTYPLYKKALFYIDSTALVQHTYFKASGQHTSTNPRHPLEQTRPAAQTAAPQQAYHWYTSQLGLKAAYNLRYPLNWLAYRHYSASLQHSFDSLDFKTNRHLWELNTRIQYDLGAENIVTLSWQALQSHAQKNSIKVATTNLSTSNFETSGVSSFFKHEPTAYNHLSKLAFQYTKVLNHSFYFISWPLSMRRWALTNELYYFTGLYKDKDKNKTTLWHPHFELAAGGKFEFLIYHKMPLRLDLLYAGRPWKQQHRFLMRLGMKL